MVDILDNYVSHEIKVLPVEKLLLDQDEYISMYEKSGQ